MLLWTLLWPPGSPSVHAGHELPYFPSFYPHEVRLHASAGGGPARDAVPQVIVGPSSTRFSFNVPRHVESLRSLILVTLRGTDRVRPRQERCALLDRAAAQAVSSKKAVFHPYPVTPYHADYLFHFDLIQSAKQRSVEPDGTPATAGATVSARSSATIEVKEVSAEDLIGVTPLPFTGWPRSPWAKEGWFQAYTALSPLLQDTDLHKQSGALYARITRGAYRDTAERLELQRRLVTLLLQDCQAAVAGYTLRREPFDDDYANGVENVAYDAQEGLNSAIFVRTVKLKAFPWNGWLNVMVGSSPHAAWNPIAGFGDPFGRLLWAVAADPAFLPHPSDGTWLPNRVRWSVPDPSWVERAARLFRRGSGRGTEIAVPADAVLPDERGMALRPVGRGQRATLRIRYRVLTSAFHDGTTMQLADVLYPYMLLSRLGHAGGLKAILAGIRVVTVEEEIKNIGDQRQVWHIPVIDLYLRGNTDAERAAVVAPPWSTVPWHVLVLMEEAVKARRWNVSRLDLVRGEAKAEMAALVDRFIAEGFVPAGLNDHITAAEARARWSALRRFYLERGHFMVTNGPYQLKGWTRTSATLRAFRDMSYPLVIGRFDRFAVPRRGYVTGTSRHGDTVEIAADVEQIMKFGRSYEILREPLRKEILTGLEPVRPACRYILINSEGRVVQAGDAAYDGDRLFKIRLPASKSDRLLVAAYVDDNYINPQVTVLPLH